MLMNNFLSSRKSVRSFKTRSISNSTFEKIRNILRIFNSEQSNSNSFFLYEDGEMIYKGLDGYAGYNGVMIKSPSYISVDIGSSSDKEKVLGMYGAEDLITFLESEGLGCCWVGLFDTPVEVREKLFGENHKPDMLLAIGYPKARNPFVIEEASERKPVDQIVFDGDLNNPIDLNVLEQRGLDDLFYYIRFAPNTMNSQTWRFVIKNQSVELYLAEYNGKYFYEDAGIIMYYYERLYNMTGFNRKWTIVDEMKPVEGFVKIATIDL